MNPVYILSVNQTLPSPQVVSLRNRLIHGDDNE
jgi:hypothetical protein